MKIHKYNLSSISSPWINIWVHGSFRQLLIQKIKVFCKRCANVIEKLPRFNVKLLRLFYCNTWQLQDCQYILYCQEYMVDFLYSGFVNYILSQNHCVKSVQIRDFFWPVFSRIRTEYAVFSPNAGKYGPEKTPYLDTFHAVSFYPII